MAIEISWPSLSGHFETNKKKAAYQSGFLVFKKYYFPEEKCRTSRLAATAQTVHMTHVQGLNSGVKPKPANCRLKPKIARIIAFKLFSLNIHVLLHSIEK